MMIRIFVVVTYLGKIIGERVVVIDDNDRSRPTRLFGCEADDGGRTRAASCRNEGASSFDVKCPPCIPTKSMLR